MDNITILESTSINVHILGYSVAFSELPVYVNVISICSYLFIDKDEVRFFEEKCLLSLQVGQEAKIGPKLLI